MYKIPLNGSDERFDISINNQSWEFMVRWVDEPFNSWTFSLGQNGTWLVQGMAMIPGVNLVQYLNVGFGLRLGWYGTKVPLTKSNLGVDYFLYVTDND
jgi:hypothetical protein